MTKLKTLIFCFALICTTFLYAQNINGKVIYTASYIKKETKNPTNAALIKSAKDVNLELLFTPTVSLFKGVNFMKSDLDKGINLTSIFSGFENQFYNNLETKEFLKRTIGPDNEPYLVQEDNGLYKWTITNESKQIGKYKCFKAILNNNNTKFPTSAWFTPELPVGFGPREYQGLPGVILLLENPHIVFTATKVSINSKENALEIEKPEGILITAEAYKEKFGGIFKD
ncbi:GLPGLI family protein [Formosa sp. 3Alg 14/1]|uniref:GLPGLI family protein n=1 Tax=unclassified Formosa TaxID=2644710 RepID=UPI0039BE5A08